VEIGVIMIFWYGVLHAFSPDHLTVIANFSIAKERNRALLNTLLFAFGHGMVLVLFAKLITMSSFLEPFLPYADKVAALVLIYMGMYLLWMIYKERITLSKHEHDGKVHVHIYFKNRHNHEARHDRSMVVTLAALMGAGGLRGMLLSLGVVGQEGVDIFIVLYFVSGVTLVFLLFGWMMTFVNQHLLQTQQQVNHIFGGIGVLCMVVGSHFLIG
jgi:nickel/cobalt transporter (NicO) family protein